MTTPLGQRQEDILEPHNLGISFVNIQQLRQSLWAESFSEE